MKPRRRLWWIVAGLTLLILASLLVGYRAGTQDQFAFLNRFNPRRVDYPHLTVSLRDYVLVFPKTKYSDVLHAMRGELLPLGYVEDPFPTGANFWNPGHNVLASCRTERGGNDDLPIGPGEFAVCIIRPKSWIERQVDWVKAKLHLE